MKFSLFSTPRPADNRNAKEISMWDVYWIFGNANEVLVPPEEKDMHPFNKDCYKDKDLNNEMREYMSKTTDSDGKEVLVYDYDSYKRRVEARCEKFGLVRGKHFDIVENTRKFNMGGVGGDYYAKYEVTIKNLRINIDKCPMEMSFQDIEDNVGITKKFVGMEYRNNLQIVFDSNRFVSNVRYMERDFLFLLYGNTYMIFKNNSFDVSMSIGGQRALVELINNKFNEQRISIFFRPQEILGRMYMDAYGHYSSGSVDIVKRYEREVNSNIRIGGKGLPQMLSSLQKKANDEKSDVTLKDILNMLLCTERKITVSEKDVKRGESCLNVYMKDNVINNLEISGIGCKFQGKNTIHKISMLSDMESIYWGRYQRIDPKGIHPDSNKEVFLRLVEHAAKNNDTAQEMILRRELIKCEKALLRREKISRSWQDRIILGWGWIMSDHGISWVRPFGWLLLANGVLATMLCAPLGSRDWWKLLFELFYPLSHVPGGADDSGGSVTFFLVFHKFLLAAVYYEMIKIFRRFSR